VSARIWGLTIAVAMLGACSPSRPAAHASSPGPRVSAGSGTSVLLITIDTLRADHLGIYGYRRNTSPHIDALGRQGTVFDAAFTFWPKTRGSFVMIHTGRRPSQNGYSRRHPVLLGLNPTIASVLGKAGYLTTAVVDNPNVAAQYGYGEGFERYRETWEEAALATEMDRARAITEDGIHFIQNARPERPFFLWLHYVNPHAPYTPPPPYDTAFLDAESRTGPALPIVRDFHGGIPKQWAVAGRHRSAYYVAQYDGEIAAVDHEVGRVVAALQASAMGGRTVVVLTADHGESLGEHGYYFDHGEDLFDPCLRIPLVIVAPGAPGGRRAPSLASTLDLMPTILDVAKVSYPPDLAGVSLLPLVFGTGKGGAGRLEAQNERDLVASFDARFKTVRTPVDGEARFALYDRERDPGETRDVGAALPDALRIGRREVELFLERTDREWARTRPLVQGRPEGEGKMTAEACEKMKALGYVQQCAP
jgi:arylsulfatase A-like enzyme